MNHEYPKPIPTPDMIQDGSGFAIMSMPLPKNHWALQQTEHYEAPPMEFRMGVHDRVSFGFERATDTHDPLDRGISHGVSLTREGLAQVIRAAGKYAYRASTMQGKEPDLDPDALLQNLVVAFLGYWTENGLSSDEWANPAKHDEHC